MLTDYPADSGAAEMYTADEPKMAVSPQQKAMSVLYRGGKINYYSSAKTLPSMENKRLEDSPSSNS
jgi:hypothetical protein